MKGEFNRKGVRYFVDCFLFEALADLIDIIPNVKMGGLLSLLFYTVCSILTEYKFRQTFEKMIPNTVASNRFTENPN